MTATLNPTPENIKSARTVAGLTQNEAAQVVHVNLRTWQKYEAGNQKMMPGLYELFLIKTEQLKP